MRYLASFLLLTALAAAAEGAPGNTSTSVASAVQSALVAAGDLPLAKSDWHPLVAPGSTMTPAAQARRRWMLPGWSKMILRGSAGTATKQDLPDEWSRGRDYERAVYVLKIDLGTTIPGSLWLGFDAVAHQCVAFVNGEKVGEHLGGFTPFAFDITRVAHPGANTIALFVRDEHAVEFADDQRAISQLGVTHPGGFTSVAGIRGGVFLEARPSVHVDRVMVQTSTRRNELRVSTWLQGAGAAARVSHEIYAWPDGKSPVLQIPAAPGRAGSAAIVTTTAWRDALRWSPEHPNLYVLRTTVESGGGRETVETRFGFREFWTEGRQFILNGTPTRLLGTSVARDFTAAITPEVGRRYSRDAFAFLKREFNYRAMRLHASIHPRAAVEAADEMGILLINQSGIWSAMGGFYQRGGEEFMRNMEREFGEWFWRDANSPAVVIWDVENEMIRDLRTPERERWVLALDRFIKQLDPTRIVEHAGAAWYSPQQETIHVHMQEQYAAVLRDWQRTAHVPLVLGEFWAGGRGGENRLPNAYEFADRLDWLQEESRIYREKILEMRSFGASAVMPFWLDRTSLARVNPGVRRTYNPDTDRIYDWPVAGLKNLGGEALAPIIGFVWPRASAVAEGDALRREIVVCNDTERTVQLTVTCDFGGQQERWPLTLAPAAQDRHALTLTAARSGDLVVSVADAAGRVVATDNVSVHVITGSVVKGPSLTRRLVVAPAPDAETAATLDALGLRHESVAAIPRDARGTLLLIPPGVGRDALGRNGVALREFLVAGGRALVLRQTEQPAWLPTPLPFWPSSKKSAPEFTLLGWPVTTRHLLYGRETAVFAAEHPAFNGMRAADMAEWDLEDGRVSDDAWIRPGALDLRAGSAYRVLAGGTRRENATLVETSFGAGTAVFCQLIVTGRHVAPGARALFANLVRYLDGAGWQTPEQQLGILGNLSPALVSKLTGLAPANLISASGKTTSPKVVVAGPGAEPASVDALVASGHTVLVLSAEVANKLPGYAGTRSNRLVIGSRGKAADDPLFWGIATGSFIPVEETPVKGVLSQYPATARIALNGLSGFNVGGGRGGRGANAGAERIETMMGEKPIATVESRGAGRLVVTTIEPWGGRSESQRQLLCTLLANAGVQLPTDDPQPPYIGVKTTVPLQFDGRLDDWTNDMEDRNVSRYQHAVPIVLGSRDVVAGTVANDAELSGICYLLHDAKNLYFAGAVFGGEATRCELQVRGHVVAVEVRSRGVTLDGRKLGGAAAFGSQPARDITDARLLTLANFNAQIGSFSAASEKGSRTFEVAVPLDALDLATATETAVTLRLVSTGGATLQVPGADAGGAARGLQVRFER